MNNLPITVRAYNYAQKYTKRGDEETLIMRGYIQGAEDQEELMKRECIDFANWVIKERYASTAFSMEKIYESYKEENP